MGVGTPVRRGLDTALGRGQVAAVGVIVAAERARETGPTTRLAQPPVTPLGPSISDDYEDSFGGAPLTGDLTLPIPDVVGGWWQVETLGQVIATCPYTGTPTVRQWRHVRASFALTTPTRLKAASAESAVWDDDDSTALMSAPIDALTSVPAGGGDAVLSYSVDALGDVDGIDLAVTAVTLKVWATRIGEMA